MFQVHPRPIILGNNHPLGPCRWVILPYLFTAKIPLQAAQVHTKRPSLDPIVPAIGSKHMVRSYRVLLYQLSPDWCACVLVGVGAYGLDEDIL
jgi:hypothetical protein